MFASPVFITPGRYMWRRRRKILRLILLNFFSRAIGNGLKTIQTDKYLDRYNDRLSADSRPIYRTAIYWLSTKCRATIHRVLTNYWPIHRSSIDQLLAKWRWKVGEMSVKYRWKKIGRDTVGTNVDCVSTEYRPIIVRLSTDCRPTIDRVSTEYRPAIDRVSTDYIDR